MAFEEEERRRMTGTLEGGGEAGLLTSDKIAKSSSSLCLAGRGEDDWRLRRVRMATGVFGREKDTPEPVAWEVPVKGDARSETFEAKAEVDPAGRVGRREEVEASGSSSGPGEESSSVRKELEDAIELML